jgi:hypothetical protein
LCLPAAASAGAADAGRPAVVELFTSQGCSSCPPANDAVARLAARPDVLALSFGVTYWDQLGWKDTFAHPAFTSRQRDYARRLGSAQVYTPQVVVNGRAATVGNTPGSIERLIRRHERPADAPGVRLQTRAVAVEAGSSGSGAEVWMVRYDPRTIQVPIRRGENGGKTLPHRNVVRELVRLGAWSGEARSYPLPAPESAGLRTAVLIQATATGAILAAAKE